MKKIAVIGSGVSGIVASFYLDKYFHVDIYETNDYIGGHTHTLMVDEGDRQVPVDTGFIVFNDKTYPNFERLLKDLNVHGQKSDMSFSYYNPNTNTQYAGTDIKGLFAGRGHWRKPSHLKMLWEIYHFGMEAVKDLEKGQGTIVKLKKISLGKYVRQKGYSKKFIDDYLKPMGSAIWSTPTNEILEYPAWNFLMFFRNHGLLDFRQRPQWYTVKGGSHTYVQAFTKKFKGNIFLNKGISDIYRFDNYIELIDTSGQVHTYDAVVIATHADQAIKLLKDPSELEKKLLNSWTYTLNETVLHKDKSLMPPNEKAWASWNTREWDNHENKEAFVTYYMNRLQNINSSQQYFVTLNGTEYIDPDLIVAKFVYQHPLYNTESINSQKDLDRLNGYKSTYFCGSYFNHGFHEDAVTAGMNVVKHLGVDIDG